MLMIFILFILGIFCFLVVRKHMFLCLISLELMIVYLLVMLYLMCIMYYYSLYIYIICMTFFVCEGALGLSIMVYLIRCHSNDYLNSMMVW